MRPLGSSILIVGISHGPSTLALEYDCIPRLDLLPRESRADVLVVPVLLAASEIFKERFGELRRTNSACQIILLCRSEEHASIAQALLAELPVFRLLEDLEDPALDSSLLAAIEKARWSRQNEQLRTLVSDQNKKLTHLYSQLEERIEKRTKFLEESRRRLLEAQGTWERLRQITVAIHQASSIAEIESRLFDILASTHQLVGIKIQSLISDLTFKSKEAGLGDFVSYQVTLFNAAEKPDGVVLFLRAKAQPFEPHERELFNLLSETLSPALQKLKSLKNRESFKEEWEATFNAVSDPVLIINHRYEILQTNVATQKKADTQESLSGTHCYQALFRRDEPCPNCQLGKKFRLEQKGKTFEVSSQPVLLSPDEPAVFVNQYHNVTERIRIERRILESARLAEIGTIGSSIAHEINNPLGGILSYAQLIKMDLTPDHPLWPDLEEIEKGALRCRDIVQNLLSFTRVQSSDKKIPTDLKEILQKAIAIIDLKARPHGIHIKVKSPSDPLIVIGHPSQLIQAFQNILQSALSSVLEKLTLTGRAQSYRPLIEVDLQIHENEFLISILDNGRGPDSTPSLEIPIASQILIEHGATLEILAPPQGLRMAKITVTRPVFTP